MKIHSTLQRSTPNPKAGAALDLPRGRRQSEIRRNVLYLLLLLFTTSPLAGCFRANEIRPLDPEEKLALIETLERESQSGQPESRAKLGFVHYMTGDEPQGLALMEPAVRAGTRDLPAALIVLRRSFEAGAPSRLDLELSRLLLPDLKARDSELAAPAIEGQQDSRAEEITAEMLRAEFVRAAERDLVHSARWLAERRIATEDAERLASATIADLAPSSVRADAVAVLQLRQEGARSELADACTEMLLDTLTHRGWITASSFVARQVEAELDRTAGEKTRVSALEPINRTKGVQQRLRLLGRTPEGPKYYEGADDGRMNAATAKAIRAFQQDHGLVPDGVVGPRTKTALDGAIGARYEQSRPEGKLLRAVQAGRAAGCQYVLTGDLAMPEPDRVHIAVDLVDGVDHAILTHAEADGSSRDVRKLLGDLAQELEPYRPGRLQVVLSAESATIDGARDSGLRAATEQRADSLGTTFGLEGKAHEALIHLGTGLSLVEERSWLAAEGAFESAAGADSTLEIANRWKRDLSLFSTRLDRYLDAAFETRVAAFRDGSR